MASPASCDETRDGLAELEIFLEFLPDEFYSAMQKARIATDAILLRP